MNHRGVVYHFSTQLGRKGQHKPALTNTSTSQKTSSAALFATV
jgi:hypothetical protein